MVGLHRILVIPTRLNDKIWSNYLCSCLNHSTMEIRLCCSNDGISHMHIFNCKRGESLLLSEIAT